MFINWQSKEINLKIVYYGAALSGKTTNLEWMHQKIAPTMRGNLVSLKTREDRTIFFDFMQIELGEIKGLKPKFNLYTVPGQVFYVASRKLVLQGADGVVFVVECFHEIVRRNIEFFPIHSHKHTGSPVARRIGAIVIDFEDSFSRIFMLIVPQHVITA